jgi:myo-inositol-1(or 4)-monophosphatase
MAIAEIEVAFEAARQGGEVVARYFREGVEVRGKETYNLVTDADVESEKKIVETIRKTFPEHQVLGEEFSEADLSAEHLWIVDPLDGTNNFAHKIPHFAISIAYYRGGVAQCGVVWNPITDTWFSAERGCGAKHNGAPIHVSEAERLDQVLVGCGFFYDRGAMMEATLQALGDLFRQNIHGIRRFGTASLDLCNVAMGRFGGFFEYELAPWDFAAGALILTEAGGKISTCRGGALPIAKTDLLASNGKLHPAIQSIVGPHCPQPPE